MFDGAGSFSLLEQQLGQGILSFWTAWIEFNGLLESSACASYIAPLHGTEATLVRGRTRSHRSRLSLGCDSADYCAQPQSQDSKERLDGVGFAPEEHVKIEYVRGLSGSTLRRSRASQEPLSVASAPR